MKTTIVRLDGTTYDLESIGITTRDFVVSSPKPRHFTETVDARHGVIDMGTVWDSRSINASFYLKAVDFDDYTLFRDEVFRMFRSDESFYVIDSRNPGKRWLVKTANSYDIDQNRIYGFFDVNFVAYSGFAESVGTTQDPMTFDAELWQAGMGFPADSADLQYTFSTPTFSVYNAGDISVDPRYLALKITFTGASTNLSITNNTTGDAWSFTGTSNTGDSVVLDGVRATKNGLSIMRNTNRKLLTLASGWNAFTITGASGSFTVSYGFRFYYL